MEGQRFETLQKERERAREQYEQQRAKLINETEKARPSNARFVGQHETVEESLRRQTVGLQRLEDFQQKRKELEELKAREAAKTDELKYVLRLQLMIKSSCYCEWVTDRTWRCV